jgi:hypothetical protein
MSARAGRTAHGPTSPTRPDSLSSSPPLAHATLQARRRASRESTDLDTPAASPARASSATAPTVSCTACTLSVRGPDAAGSARAGSAEAAFRRVFHFCQSRRARGEIMASGLTVSMPCARAKAVAPAPASVLRRRAQHVGPQGEQRGQTAAGCAQEDRGPASSPKLLWRA